MENFGGILENKMDSVFYTYNYTLSDYIFLSYLIHFNVTSTFYGYTE